MIITFLHEKVFADSIKDGRSVKYILAPPNSGNSTDMIVSFPACGYKAKYNYVRTLKEANCWRLFIKDDFGEALIAFFK